MTSKPASGSRQSAAAPQPGHKPEFSPATVPVYANPTLAAAKRWFWHRAAAMPERTGARFRMWFIFMLLRYGGLRLTEIFSLTAPDLDFARGLVRVRSARGLREVPLAPPVSAEMHRVWQNIGYNFGQQPFACDASLVRRALGQCALACGQLPAALNVRALRRARERELESLGLPRVLIDIFLGRNAGKTTDWHNVAAAIRQAVHRETEIRTSARNMFYGQVTRLVQKGILIDVSLQAAGELNISCLITDTSCKSLALEVGSFANAMVKAPWVHVGAPDDLPSPLPPEFAVDAAKPNVYPGIVERVRQDKLARETVILLPQGHTLCALSPTENASVRAGQEVVAAFSPLAVILTVNTRQTR